MLLGRRLWPTAAAQARFRPRDVYQGLGLYETVGCQDGLPLLWQAHTARFLNSTHELYGVRPVVPDEKAAKHLLESCGLGQGPAALRLVWFFPRRSALVWATRYRVPRGLREKGAHLTTAFLPANPLTGHKTTSVGAAQLLHRQALAAGFDGVLFFDHQDLVRETATANIFAVFGNEVFTPPAPSLALPGVVRRWCISYLQEVGWRVVEARFSLERLFASDGAFLTSSLAGVVPVRAIDHRLLPFPPALREVLQNPRVPAPGYR